ncbi:hypothetical protein NYO67_3539 [Aspergillus flavus]|nr:hypothetical protein NYO67_3539 [Aspergillus flavus]
MLATYRKGFWGLVFLTRGLRKWDPRTRDPYPPKERLRKKVFDYAMLSLLPVSSHGNIYEVSTAVSLDQTCHLELAGESSV